MSATNSMFEYLLSGRRLTTKQARTMFKIDNVADVVYRLRNEGTPVYTHRVILKNGTHSFAYSMGESNETFVRAINNRQFKRARKMLYSDALDV